MSELATDGERQGSAVKRVAVSLAVVLAIAAGIYFLDTGREQSSAATLIDLPGASGPAPRVGSPAPDFQAPDLDGRVVRLSDFRGKTVWINFWASWCPPCRAETPDVEAAYRERQDDGLVLLGVSIGEDAATVRRYVETSGITYTVLLDQDQSIATRYRVNGIPTHLFLDREGAIQGLQVGGLSKSAILRRLSALMTPS